MTDEREAILLWFDIPKHGFSNFLEFANSIFPTLVCYVKASLVVIDHSRLVSGSIEVFCHPSVNFASFQIFIIWRN